MASLPDGITLDIPDLRVTITPRSDYIVTIQPVDEYHVVTFDTPTVTRATSVFVDYAQSASYANSAGSAVSASYAEVSATSSYADNFVVAGGVTASGFVGDGSQLTGITAEGTGVSVQDDTVFRGLSQVLNFADGLDVSFVTPTSSISLNRTGSFTGSFSGDGSGLTDIVSASFATTASYVEGTFSGSQVITGQLTASGLNYPSTDGDAYQLFKTDGQGSITLDYADRLALDVKNTSGGLLSKGTPVYITGFQGDGIYQIAAADSSDVTKMPAVGILSETLAENDVGHAVLYGALRGIDTLLYSVGDELFVGVGELTGSAPQHPSLIQKIASVGNSANNGEITILGAGRSNAVSNLGSGQIFYGVENRATTQSLASILSGNAFSYSGSFTGDGSNVTGVVSSSYALTASYVEGAASDWDTLANKPSGLVSSSTQTIANINGQEITPSIISSSGHIVPSTTEIYDLGSTDLRWRDLYLSGSTIYLGSAEISSDNGKVSGSFTGSFTGDASSITGVVSSSFATTASYAENAGVSDWNELTNVPSGLVSSSTQVDYDSIQNVPSGILSASSFTSPSQGTVRATINGVQTDVDTGLQTGDSPQFTNLTLSGDLTVNGTTTYISSSQVDIGDQIITLNANNAAGDGGIYVNDTSTNETGSLLWDVSENYWIGGLLGSESELITLTSLNAKGVVSSSGQVDYTGLSNVPSGIVSSSTQFTDITAPFTGSFSGSFSGDGAALTGLVSSSYALTASYAENGGGGGGVTINNNTDNYLVTATGTSDTLDGEQFLTWDGVKLTVSSSDDSQQQLQIYAGTQTGSIHVNNGTVYFQGTNSDIRIRHSSGGNNDLVYIGTDFYPAPNGTINFGRNNNRWETIYTTDVSASGDVSASTFTGDGSQVTGVVTSSYSNTASYVETAQTASYFIGDISFPSGLEVTGSLLLDGSMSACGDVTASGFIGDGSQITGVVSSSYALTASYVETAQTSSTAQTASYVESAQTASYVDGLISFPNGLDVTGSLLIDGDISASGTITGSAFFGDGSNITGIVSAQTASYIDGFVNFDQGIVVTGSLIASGGLAGIGEPNPSYDLDVNGIVRADAYYWDTAAPQQTPSDSRLKTKVTPLPPQSDRICDVNLVEFEWSELNDTRPSRQNRTKRQGTKDVGVIAQELQEIFPELVSEDVDGYLTVSYVGLLIPLIKTVQEQQKQIDELKKLISGEE